MDELILVSHNLCPYVQRAVISLTEKSVAFRRVDVDLGNKPEWFKALSPLGRTPVLRVADHAIFESAVILEYLEETQPHPLHPSDPLARADHRAWIEVGSAILADISGLYSAIDATAFERKAKALASKFDHLERRLSAGPYFDGARFSLVDVVFGPIFRYFDVFDGIGDFGVLADKPKVNTWRRRLAERASIRDAVDGGYQSRLLSFLEARRSHLSTLMPAAHSLRPSRQ